MARRIDALRCSKAAAPDCIGSVIAETKSRAEAARKEVSSAITERVGALQKRQAELLAEIDKVCKEKVKALEKQLKDIQAGTCPPMPPEDPDEKPDPDAFLLCADAIISFRLGEADFLEKVPEFGAIGEASTYSSRSYAKGPALGVLKVETATYLWVYACDREGKRRKEGGDNVVAKLSSPEAFGDVAVEDMKDGRYKVKFTPLQAGSYTLDITVGPENAPEALQGGPFSLAVRPGTEYHQIGGEEHVEGRAKVGEGATPQDASVPQDMGNVHHPGGVDFDHTGRFYFVADQNNHRVQVFDTEDHKPLAAFGKKGQGSADLDTPMDIVAEEPWCHGSRVCRLVVTDLLNHRLQVLEYNVKTKEMRHVRSVGGRGEGPGEFQFPKGMTLTEHGHILVCDSGNHRVQVFDMLDGFSFVREFGLHGVSEGQFTQPLDVALNCQGEVLVSDSLHRIQVFSSEGAYLRSFGQKGRKDGMFDHPTNMAVDDENALFVCDQGNHRVQVLDASTGAFRHKWGGSRKKKGEGEEEEAPADEGEEGEKPPEWVGLRSPAGIAVNTHGTVIVSDYTNNVLFAF